MPVDNRFRHQDYHRQPPPENWRIVAPGRALEPESPDFAKQLISAGEALRAQEIDRIYLVHGTLAGTDLAGLNREVQRVAPRLAMRMGSQWKQLIDMFAGDMGNYTQQSVDVWNHVNAAQDNSIDIRRFFWSSENHHLGRADAAVRLLVELSRSEPTDRRIMLWGHSHAGNVFAILTNLLGGDQESRERFFVATKAFVDRHDDGTWRHARALLLEHEPGLVEATKLDLVTFGTPIRYGWECRGYGRLLHFVNHRVLAGVPPPRVPFPPTTAQLRKAEAGDYFQQIFIAGTNAVLSVYSLQKWQTERRLHRLLQKEVSSRRIWDSLSQGRRVAEDGLTLLIDYVASGDTTAAKLGGHAVYTRRSWLPFHLEQVIKWFSATPVMRAEG